jgi:hypothetical protein
MMMMIKMMIRKKKNLKNRIKRMINKRKINKRKIKKVTNGWKKLLDLRNL